MTASASLEMAPAIAPIASPATWPVLTELNADAAQQVFHDLMEAMSRPGEFRSLGENTPTAPVPAVVVPLLTLIDLMTPVTGLAGSSEEAVVVREVLATLSRLTGAPIVEPAGAAFALALDEPASWGDLNPGSHWSPEYGATLVQRVAALGEVESGEQHAAERPSALTLRLTGPGIHPERPTVITVSGLSEAWFAQRAELTSSYPAGIDCVLITDAGTFVCLPRTTKIEVL